MKECLGLAKAFCDEKNKWCDNHDDDRGKDHEPLGMRAMPS
jgi:hypothetical protein